MEKQYDFYGRHLLLNFSGCDVDLNDLNRIKSDMIYAVNQVGATILSHLEHKFEPSGLSVVLLLSESHASIHTYPEHQSCFLDLFTCGTEIDVRPYGDILAELWQPKYVSSNLQERFDPMLVQLREYSNSHSYSHVG